MKTREPRHAIVIEDHPDFADIHIRLLRPYGLEVHHAADTTAGFRLLADFPRAALVILDMQLPDGGGPELLQYLEDSATLRERTVIVTGFPLIGRSFAHTIPVIDKAGLRGLPRELSRILGPGAEITGDERR